MSQQRRFCTVILATIGLLLNISLTRAGPIFEQPKPSEHSGTVKKKILSEYASDSDHNVDYNAEIQESLSDQEMSYVIGNPKIVTKVGGGLPSTLLKIVISVGLAVLVRSLIK